MATIEISAKDVTDATNFLEEYLTDSIPEGDFTKGTALRDLTVNALAAVFAFLKKENNLVKAAQSLETVSTTVDNTDTQALDDAVTSILSNWFINRKQGSRARGTIVGHVSQLTDIFIRPSTNFYKTSSLIFNIDSDDTYFIPKEELIPQVSSDSSIIEYQFIAPVVAAAVGEAYNISAGLFVNFDPFNVYVTRIENLDTFIGGKSIESTQEVLARAPSTISVRNLINEKSITAVLEEEFPEITKLLTVGYGDPEMVRDILQGLAAHLAVHTGGMVDIFVDYGVSETSFTGKINGTFLRPDNKAVIFTDSTLTGTRLFTDSPSVEPGDIIRISAGLDTVPAEFKVVAVESKRLFISERTPFPKATDEETDVLKQFVSYTIGRFSPLYADIISNTGFTSIVTGQTSRTVSKSGRITMPGNPIFGISDVAIINPDLGDPFIDANDGYIHFTERVNDTIDNVTDPLLPLQYAVRINNPYYAQSVNQWAEIDVGPTTNLTRWDNKNLKITYKTLSGFSSVNSFINNKFERVVCANLQAKGLYPVILSLSLTCKLKATATSIINTSDVAQTIADYINSFNTTESPIDISGIMEQVRNTYPEIGAILPFSISYYLSTPTGAFITYSTTDEVIVDSSKRTGGADIDLNLYGVSTRLLKYLTTTGNISVTLS